MIQEDTMFQNVGTVDRVIRLIAGIAIVIAGVMFKSWLGLLGLVPLLTAGIGICPLYLPFRISTKRAK
jgi:hypothetical protein